MIISLLIFLVILSILVLIHEFGHYIVARKLGIKVEEFGLGFPPRIYGIKRGETVFSLNLFPIGGFVRLHGEDEAGSGRLGTMKRGAHDLKRAFFARPPWQRALVAVAGVVMNFFLAVVIYYAFFFLSNFSTIVPLVEGDHRFFGAEQSNIRQGVYILEVVEDSPADLGGVMADSTVLTIDNNRIENTDEFLTTIDENIGEQIDMTLERSEDGSVYTAEVVPQESDDEGSLGVGFNYTPMDIAVLQYESPIQKVTSGITYPINLAIYTVEVLGSLIGQSFEEGSIEPVGENVAGPVGIYAVVDQAVQIPDLRERVMQTLNLAGLLSISLAILNILPIPALDGGRIAFIGIEKIFGRAISVKFESYAHAVGMILLLGLIILITIRDIGRFF